MWFMRLTLRLFLGMNEYIGSILFAKYKIAIDYTPVSPVQDIQCFSNCLLNHVTNSKTTNSISISTFKFQPDILTSHAGVKKNPSTDLI
jgi:hypothetical protein